MGENWQDNLHWYIVGLDASRVQQGSRNAGFIRLFHWLQPVRVAIPVLTQITQIPQIHTDDYRFA